ncbi:MAG: imidazolonepropionase [Candidatus Marinimicrobia bacterium]|nr:imidazolonepropionase [Candidatus Neomarinimicrobiota bacterium]MCF7840774.1 imidazolonepropionase [Candidatus Neomarinimicrobiota bacterium]
MLKGITNLGQWITWNPVTQQMEVGEGGSIVFDGERVGEITDEVYSGTDWLNAEKRFVSPGLVDSHTHPAFAATRELEFELRGQGKSYQEIAAAGGGIRNSVKALRQIGQESLTALIAERFSQFLDYGTTTLEAKSGYGLSLESELKSLQAITAAAQETPLTVKRTFLGAHEFPDEYRENREMYIGKLTEEMIPAVTEADLAEYCDVFCEEGVYTPEETREIALVARKHGLGIRLHADEFVSTGGAELASELGALSADHLMAISEEGIRALTYSDVVATLLPGTTFFLGQTQWAPARRLLDAGATIALATDFNPGSNMTLSMPFIMTLAVIYLHLTPLEAWQAATYGGSKALGLAQKTGAIHPGYYADCVIWDCKNYRQVPYFYAMNRVHSVVKAGLHVR